MTNEETLSLKQIIKRLGEKNYSYVEQRIKYFQNDGQQFNIFSGCFSIIDGKINSLDGDAYSEEDIYAEWEEWIGEGGNKCLTVYRHVAIEVSKENEPIMKGKKEQ